MRQAMQRILTLIILFIFPCISLAASDDIARLYNFSAGTTIQSSQVNAEFNQLVNTSNTKAGRGVNNTMTGNNTFSGTNVFSGTATFSNGTSGLLTDSIKEFTSGNGVTVGSVLLKSGYIRPTLSSDPTTVEGNVWYNSTGHALKYYDGVNTQTVATAALTPILQSYLSGLTISNDGTTPTTDIDVAAGIAADSTAVDYIKLSAIVKRVSTAWTVGTGNGCLDTGSIPTSGTVHIFAIKRTDTAVTDVLCSVSASSPTMPSGYTEKRRIGSVLTDGSAHILAFYQQGDDFLLLDPILDINTTDGTTATTRTITVPNGINVRAMLNVFIANSSPTGTYISSLNVNDDSTSTTANVIPTLSSDTGTGTRSTGGQVLVWTNTSGQIRTRSVTATTTLRISTTGWMDRRGRDS